MRLGDTIIAPATGPASGGIAIVRLSGPDATSACTGALNASLPTGRGFGGATITIPCETASSAPSPPDGLRTNPPTTIPCGIASFPAPGSYTGEDIIELHLPGHPTLIRRVIDALLSNRSVRLAEPGEFTARAFLNQRLSAEQAEGVRAIIEARSTAQLSAARRLLSGRLGETYRGLAEDLAGALALVEAGIDFTDQDDVTSITPEDLARRMGAIIGVIEPLIAHSAPAEQRLALPRVVIGGRPNAGKSTLFNALIGRERSVACDMPGTTRDTLAETIDIAPGVPIALCDTAGLDSAWKPSGTTEAHAMDAARHYLGEADLIIWCDPLGRFELDDPAIGETARHPPIRVRTKADLPVLGGRTRESTALTICSLDGSGLPALRRAIGDAIAGICATASGDDLAVLPRHRQALRSALLALREAHAGAVQSTHQLASPELIAAAMRNALDELGTISGEISPDDVIGRIFATFCIGK